MSCILRHRGVQLILAYSWARPAVLAAGKGRGGMFFFIVCKGRAYQSSAGSELRGIKLAQWLNW